MTQNIITSMKTLKEGYIQFKYTKAPHNIGDILTKSSNYYLRNREMVFFELTDSFENEFDSIDKIFVGV